MASQPKTIDPVTSIAIGKAPEALVLTAVANLAREAALKTDFNVCDTLNANTETPIINSDNDEEDWVPGPEHCADPLELFRDAKAGKRTVLDLFSPEEREQLLKDIK